MLPVRGAGSKFLASSDKNGKNLIKTNPGVYFDIREMSNLLRQSLRNYGDE
jgi:hypothetical protein